jgi:hypothetical protein
MSDHQVELSMQIPLDSEGFLRRECPTCEREFKWLHTSGEEEVTEPGAGGGYFCPYCGVQAPPSDWLTQAQIELAQNIVETEVVGPMVKKFSNDVKKIFSSGGMINASVSYDKPDKLDPLIEADDMRRVEFGCHPSEPLKVLDDWHKPVHCLICGKASS